MSAINSMGNISPLETLPPKAMASRGTDNMPAPCTPVLAMPNSKATDTTIAIFSVLRFERIGIKVFFIALQSKHLAEQKKPRNVRGFVPKAGIESTCR